jgi:hypothetical protein
MSSNPYEAPRAPLTDLSRVPELDDFLDEPRRVPAGNGWQWIVSAWELLKAAPGPWALLVLIAIGVAFTCGALPFIGGLLQQFVTPFSSAAVAAQGELVRNGQAPGMSEVMDRVMKRASQLLVVGAVLVGATICVAIVVFTFFILVSRNNQNSGLFVSLAGLGLLVLFLPLMMATYFAPALICLHEKTAVEAMRLSLRACWRNFWPFTVLTLCAMGLAIVATLPLLLGWFLLIPVMFVVSYSAYRDIFFDA